jgi:hypothetical protein
LAAAREALNQLKLAALDRTRPLCPANLVALIFVGRFGTAADLALGTDFTPGSMVLRRDRAFGLAGGALEGDIIRHEVSTRHSGVGFRNALSRATAT